MRHVHVVGAFALAFALTGLLAACGGGGGSTAATPSEAPSRAWGSAEVLATDADDDFGSSAIARVAIDDAGAAQVVWVEAGTSHLVGRRYAAGQWAPVEPLVSAAVRAPALAMAGTGNATLVWGEPDDPLAPSLGTLRASRYDAATGQWGTAETLAADVRLTSDHLPQVAMAGNGDAQVVWNRDDPMEHAEASRYAAGQWEGVIELANGMMVYPQLVMNRRGDTAAVSFRSGGIYVQRAAPGGEWGAPEEMRRGDAAISAVLGPQVAVDAAGNVTALWLQGVPANLSLQARRYDAATGFWSAPATLVADADANLPRLAGDPSGNAVAVWLQGPGPDYTLEVRRYDAASGQWTPAETLNTEGGLPLAPFFAPEVAMDRWGNALVLWIQDDATEWTLRARRYDAAAGEWGPSEVLGSDTPGELFLPQLAMNREGEAVAVWLQYEGTTGALSVIARRYE